MSASEKPAGGPVGPGCGDAVGTPAHAGGSANAEAAGAPIVSCWTSTIVCVAPAGGARTILITRPVAAVQTVTVPPPPGIAASSLFVETPAIVSAPISRGWFL